MMTAKAPLKAPLTVGPLSRHIRKIALPMSIGFLFNTMYNVVDSFYAGRISTEALAAMALSFPVFFIIIAMSEGMARGATALIANAIGSHDREKEGEYTGQVFSLGLFIAGGLMVVGVYAVEPLFRLMGASGDYLQLAMDYIQPIFWGAVLFLLGSMCNAILLAHGDSRTFSKVLMAGFFLNLILDPWFLYGGFGVPAMGIKGIALATVLIQVFSSGYMLMTVIRRGYFKRCNGQFFSPKLRVYGEILKQGVPTSFNMMSIALGFFVMTYYLNSYGEAAVAAFGVGTRIEQIVLLPAIGLSAAVVSIVGQNNGAGELERVNECVRLCARYGIILIATSSLGMFVMATPLVRLFTDDPDVIKLGTSYVRIVSAVQWAYVMGFIFLGFLQAVKRPMYGFVESVVRKIIVPSIVFYVLVRVMDVGLTTFWWSSVVINITMAVVTILYGLHILRKVTHRAEDL